MNELFHGNLVRRTFEEPETQAKAESRWQRDSEFVRLADSDPIRFSLRKEDPRLDRRKPYR